MTTAKRPVTSKPKASSTIAKPKASTPETELLGKIFVCELRLQSLDNIPVSEMPSAKNKAGKVSALEKRCEDLGQVMRRKDQTLEVRVHDLESAISAIEIVVKNSGGKDEARRLGLIPMVAIENVGNKLHMSAVGAMQKKYGFPR